MTDKGRARAPEEIARTRIEALLKEGKLPTLETLLKREVLDLNELSLDLLTHQVEIEVQAEQLREANAALEAERRKFEQIFFHMPVAAGLIDLSSGVLTAENHKFRSLFPQRFSETATVRYIRHFGENRIDQDRISLALADCRLGASADVRAVSLCDSLPDHYAMCDIRMARLELGEDGSDCVLAIIQPYTHRL